MGIPHSTTWNSSINNILQYHCSKLEPPTLSLCVSFSSLFALATSKEAWMGDLWSRSNSRGVWTPGFSRHLNDWEIENVEHFSARLLVKGLVEGGGDKVCWSNAKSGTFSVRSLYSSLEEGRSKSFLSGMCGMLGFHLIWVSSLERWLGEKLTLDQLQRRGWSFANKNVFFVTLTKSQLTTSFYIVTRQGYCGSFCFLCLVSHGWFTPLSETLC